MVDQRAAWTVEKKEKKMVEWLAAKRDRTMVSHLVEMKVGERAALMVGD